MRIAWPKQAVVMVVSVLALVGVGCDSTQPDRIETRTASVGISSIGFVEVLNCYEAWQDVNGDGIIDGNDAYLGYMVCESVPPDLGGGQRQRPVPWHYSLSISLIHAGTAIEETVTSLSGLSGSSIQPRDGIDDFISMTDYDLAAPAVPPKIVGGTYYVNGKQVSLGSPVYLASIGLDFGAPNILSAAPTFDFDVNSGDTVVVRARKQSVAESPPFLPVFPDPELQISAVLAIGGVQVATQGTTVSSTDDKAGFSFSFTVR